MIRPKPLQTEHRFVEYTQVEDLELAVACDVMRVNAAIVRRRWIRNPEALLAQTLAVAGEAWEDTRKADRGQFILDLPAEEHPDLYRTIEPMVLDVNDRYFGLELTFWQVLRLNRFLPGSGGHELHTDYAGPEPAKLAFSILLREPIAGGETRVESYAEDPVPLSAGDGVIFPGYEPHEVRAVTEGERISLTGWLGGPPFR